MSSELKPDPNLQLLIFLNHLLDRVDYRFENQPQVKANLKASLSHSFNILGRHEDASRLCREYLEFLEQTKGPRHPDSIRVARQLISFYLDESRIAEAELLIHPTLERSTKVLGPENEITLKIRTDLATLYHEQEKFDLALDTHMQCLEIKRKAYGEEHVETLRTKSKIAAVYESLEQFDQAETLHQEVLQFNQENSGSHRKLRVAASMNNLAKCYVNRGVIENDSSRFVQAEQLLKAGLQVYPDTLEIKRNLARTYLELGRFEEAEPLLIDLEDRMNKLLGTTDPATLEVQNMLGVCYLHENRFSDSESFFISAYETLREHFPHSRQMLQVMNNLAIVYRSMGKLEQSIAMDEAALENLNKQDSAAAPFLARLGMNYLDVGQTTKGCAILESVFEAGRNRQGIHAVAGILADHYLQEETQVVSEKSNRPFENTRYWTQQQLASGQGQLNDQAFANVLNECGQRQLRMQDFAAAENTLRTSISKLETEATPSIPSLKAHALLGQALAAQTKYQLAEQVLSSTFEKMIEMETNSENRVILLHVIEQLIAIHSSNEDVAMADQWRQQKAELASASSR